jgi:hypothetical protein
MRRSAFRTFALATPLAFALAPTAAVARPLDHQRIAPLTGDDAGARRAAQRTIVRAGATELVPGLVDAVFFTPKRHRAEIAATLEALTGFDGGADYYAWVEWLGRRSDFPPGPGYAAWKGELFGRIDPAYRRFFAPDVAARLRLEEIVFGGARLDGIPSLDDPPHVEAEVAPLGDDELVFGVVLGGEARAYPHRYLSWHEMANDVVGGEPITLSY